MLSNGVEFWVQDNSEGKKRANECIINQAETIEEPQTGVAYARGEKILSEMLADIGGINASYTAYKTNTKGQEQQLPGLTEYSADQLFFLAQANVSGLVMMILSLMKFIHSLDLVRKFKGRLHQDAWKLSL